MNAHKHGRAIEPVKPQPTGCVRIHSPSHFKDPITQFKIYIGKAEQGLNSCLVIRGWTGAQASEYVL